VTGFVQFRFKQKEGEMRQKASGNNSNRPVRTGRRRVLTIGQAEGDLQGRDSQVIQAGVDYLGRQGGGTLQILPGEYRMTGYIYAHSDVTIKGCGEETVLKKAEGFSSLLARHMDWCEYGVPVKDAKGFMPGGSIMLRSKKGDEATEYDVHRATVTHIEGETVFFTPMSLQSFHLEKEVTVDTIFPLIYAEHVNDVCVEDLVLDGNGQNNPHCNGNFSGAVFTQFCHRWQFKNVIARNYNGDGFSFQASDDFTFDHCLAMNNSDNGFHPGSGAQRPRFTDCKALENGQGVFFCWNVNDGIVEGCESSRNKEHGFNFGHRDSDNIVRNCLVAENGETGIIFRKNPGEYRTADRNRIEDCHLINNGSKAIVMDDASDGTVIRNNRIEFSHSPRKHKGICVGKDVKGCELADNTFVGCQIDVEDLRSGC
jgi:hypothetical protein